jgi:hypothetical protein
LFLACPVAHLNFWISFLLVLQSTSAEFLHALAWWFQSPHLQHAWSIFFPVYTQGGFYNEWKIFYDLYMKSESRKYSQYEYRERVFITLDNLVMVFVLLGGPLAIAILLYLAEVHLRNINWNWKQFFLHVFCNKKSKVSDFVTIVNVKIKYLKLIKSFFLIGIICIGNWCHFGSVLQDLKQFDSFFISFIFI